MKSSGKLSSFIHFFPCELARVELASARGYFLANRIDDLHGALGLFFPFFGIDIALLRRLAYSSSHRQYLSRSKSCAQTLPAGSPPSAAFLRLSRLYQAHTLAPFTQASPHYRHSVPSYIVAEAVGRYKTRRNLQKYHLDSSGQAFHPHPNLPPSRWQRLVHIAQNQKWSADVVESLAPRLVVWKDALDYAPVTAGSGS